MTSTASNFGSSMETMKPAKRLKREDMNRGMFLSSNPTATCSDLMKFANETYTFRVHPYRGEVAEEVVPINFERLRDKFREMAETAYMFWCPLSVWPDDDCEETGDRALYLRNCCAYLATAVCYEIFTRIKRQQNEYSVSVEDEPFICSELPSGFCRIIEEFGIFETSGTSGTQRLIHGWDGSQPNTFGILEEHSVDSTQACILHGFLSSLQQAGVPFRRVGENASPTSAWYSLNVAKCDTTFDIATTLPVDNYQLPLDAFFAMAICGETLSMYPPPVQFIPTTKTVEKSNPIGNCYQNHDVLVVGHCGLPTAASINSVARGIYKNELSNFISVLLRQDSVLGYHDLRQDATNRLCVMPAKLASRPIVPILVNYEALHKQIKDLAIKAYDFWDELSDLVCNADSGGYIEKCRGHLATALYYLIFNRLRKRCSTRDTQAYLHYGDKSPIHSSFELPSGLCLIAEEFGDFATIDTAGNPILLHQWDRAHSDSFGIPPNTTLDMDMLQGFLSILRHAGVPFRSIRKDAVPTSAWSTIFIKGHAFEAATTLPRSNYDLPRDVFLSNALCGKSSFDSSQSVQCVASRRTKMPVDKLPVWLRTHSLESLSAIEQSLVASLMQQEDRGSNDTLYISTHCPKEAGSNQQNVTVIGRGDVSSTACVESVCSSITSQDMWTFSRTLLRVGP